MTTIHIFIAVYSGIVLCWPWPPMRFVIPILPFLLYFGYKGIVVLFATIKHSHVITRVTTTCVALILCVITVCSLIWSSKETIRTSQVSFAYAKSEDWKQIRCLLDWIKMESEKDSVILMLLDPTCYLYTGRRSINGFASDPYQLWYSHNPTNPIGSDSQLLSIICESHVNYIVRSPNVPFREGKYLNALIDEIIFKYPGLLTPVRKAQDPEYIIYRVNHVETLITHARPGD